MTNKQNPKGLKQEKLRGSQPKYVDTYHRLVEMIGRMKPGDRLPTEEALTKMYSVSRNTLRQALQVLHEDKMIYKRKGAGTFVSGTPYMGRTDISTYQTCEKGLQRLDFSVEVADITVTFEDADHIVKEILDNQEFSSIYYVSRTYVNKEEPEIRYCFCEDYVPVNINLDVSRLGKKEFMEAYEAMGKASICNITAVPAGEFYGNILKMDRESPVLVFQQVVLNGQGHKIYLNKTYINTDITENSILINRKEL